MQKIINLYCIPYAGGNSTVYYSWKKLVEPYINIIPLELSGRGTRSSEPFYHNFNEATCDLFRKIKDNIEKEPYALFGHSMGSTLAYELTQKIISSGLSRPVHVFFSGRKPPQNNKDYKKISNESIENFKKEILDLGGTPPEIFDNPLLEKIFLPILKADYRILEEYRYDAKTDRLPIDISIFFGDKDIHTPIDGIKDWNKYTSCNCKFYCIEGGHFFINKNAAAVVNHINRILNMEKEET